MNPIRIMLVEDHQVVREGLRRLIELEDGMTVVAEAGTLEEAVQNLRDDIDLVLLDIGLPDGDGLELPRKIGDRRPGLRYLALTTYDDPLFVMKAVEHGVNGFIPKYASFDDIKSAINIVMKTGRYLYPGLGSEVFFGRHGPGLTEEELQILQLLATGQNQKDVAGRLYISLSTLRRRIQGICTKLGVKTIEGALALAARKGLIK
ncbi:MAG: Two component transcriptional regulator, LuxR family [Clostridia bacterium 62_21]|nr:MAG: Two component transcriptional regulator, LuxR family [Clostridia bacterium 62_21]